jgi:hypothetical protein
MLSLAVDRQVAQHFFEPLHRLTSILSYVLDYLVSLTITTTCGHLG